MVVFDQIPADMKQLRDIFDDHFPTQKQHIADKSFAAVAFIVDERKIDPSDSTASFTLHSISGEKQKNRLSAYRNQLYLTYFVSEFDDLTTMVAEAADQSVLNFSMEKNFAF